MYKIVIPVLMGLEAVVRDELLNLGFSAEQISLANAQVTLRPEQDRHSLSKALALCNVYLACAERVELQVGEFPAADFDQLFEGTQKLSWAEWIPQRAAITVKRGYSGHSKLFAPPAIQRTIKKGIVLALQKAWGLRTGSMLQENPNFLELEICYYLNHDVARLTIDTSGVGLHKRSYRIYTHEAPLQETLAAGILRLSKFTPFAGELLYEMIIPKLIQFNDCKKTAA